MSLLSINPNDLKKQGCPLLIRERINPEEILSIGSNLRSKKYRTSVNSSIKTQLQNRKNQLLLSNKQFYLNRTQDNMQNTPQKLRINLSKLEISKKMSDIEDKLQNQLNSDETIKRIINRQVSEIKLSYRMGLSIFEDVSVRGEDDYHLEDLNVSPFVSPSRELKNIRIIPDERNNVSNIRKNQIR